MVPIDDDESLCPKIGKDLFKRVYSGKQFLQCLVELLKNCRDWNAEDIWIWTTILDKLRILDSGDGMNLENRRSFVSHAISSARGLLGKAGWFGTGTKHMLYSHCTSVRVVTAPKDTLEWVYIFEFTPEQCSEYAILGKEIPYKKEKKTKKNWPHDFDHGTDVTYTLKDPKSTKFERGKKLAEKLSARLPFFFSNILRVDDEFIPRKKIVGKVLARVEQLSFGQIAYEFYRPEKRANGEGLFLTSEQIGDIPIENLHEMLNGELRQEFPPILLLICGTLCIPWLKGDKDNEEDDGYNTEGRTTIDPRIMDDTRLKDLFSYITVVLTPFIQEYLKIQEKKKIGESDERVITEVLEQCDAIYNPEGTGGKEVKEPEDPGAGDPGDDIFGPPPVEPIPPGPPPPSIHLSYAKEYEIGETIDIKATLQKDLREKYSLNSLIWTWSEELSYAENGIVTDSGFTLTAKKEGKGGVVYATISGIPYSRARAYYDVVQKRKLSLSPRRAGIEIGDQLDIVAKNTDKVSELCWKLDGVGKISSSKDKVTYFAVKKGHATIRAYDAQNPNVYAMCDITVTRKKERLYCIRDTYFRYDPSNVNTLFRIKDSALTQPVMMISNVDTLETGEAVHQITFNEDGTGYREAREDEKLNDFLMHAISLQFAIFWGLELGNITVDEDYSDTRDMQSFIQAHIATQKDEIYKELTTPKKNGGSKPS